MKQISYSQFKMNFDKKTPESFSDLCRDARYVLSGDLPDELSVFSSKFGGDYYVFMGDKFISKVLGSGSGVIRKLYNYEMDFKNVKDYIVFCHDGAPEIKAKSKNMNVFFLFNNEKVAAIVGDNIFSWLFRCIKSFKFLPWIKLGIQYNEQKIKPEIAVVMLFSYVGHVSSA